jgi:hypothetical protein
VLSGCVVERRARQSEALQDCESGSIYARREAVPVRIRLGGVPQDPLIISLSTTNRQTRTYIAVSPERRRVVMGIGSDPPLDRGNGQHPSDEEEEDPLEPHQQSTHGVSKPTVGKKQTHSAGASQDTRNLRRHLCHVLGVEAAEGEALVPGQGVGVGSPVTRIDWARVGAVADAQLTLTADAFDAFDGRGLHSSTFQLNLSALYGIGGACRGCVARVTGVLEVFKVCRVFLFVRHGSS